MNDIDWLGSKGDLVERTIVASAREPLACLLAPYAGVWADQIVGRRQEGSVARIEPQWAQFAGSHYAAMLRVYTAHKALVAINDLCCSEDLGSGEKLLR